MTDILRSTSIFIVGIIVGSLTVPALSAQVREATVTRLMTLDLAGFCDGKQVLVDVVENGPGSSGKHYHPGYAFGYVIDGSQTSTPESGPPVTVKAGDFTYELPMQVSTSETTSTFKVFGVRLVEKGKPTTVRVP